MPEITRRTTAAAGASQNTMDHLLYDPSGGPLAQAKDDPIIVGFREDWLRTFFVDGIRSRNIPPELQTRLFRKLQMIDDATTDQDLRVPPSNHFEKL